MIVCYHPWWAFLLFKLGHSIMVYSVCQRWVINLQSHSTGKLALRGGIWDQGYSLQGSSSHFWGSGFLSNDTLDALSSFSLALLSWMEKHEDPPGHQLLTLNFQIPECCENCKLPSWGSTEYTRTFADLHSAFGAPLRQPKCASRTAGQAPAVSFMGNDLQSCLEMNFLIPKFSSSQKRMSGLLAFNPFTW